MRRLLILAASSAVLACSGTNHVLGDSPDVGSDAGCGNPCGTSCCGAHERCVDDACCAPDCAGRACGSDGCGGSCGTCETGWTCNTDKGTCECPAESDDAFCARMNVVCGKATGKDACGKDRSIDCDRCASGKHCDQGSTTCICPETDTQLCARLGKDCDTLTADDLCGQSRTVTCGTCGAGELCSASNTCELCSPQLDADFCASNGKQCGTFTAQDPCSQQSRTPVCPACQPGFECDAASQCEACAPETKEVFCQRLGKNCGGVTAPDRCRLEQTFDCGTCTGTDTCGPDNTCIPCAPESDLAFCQRSQIPCGPFQGIDNCLAARSVADCGACGTGEVCTPGNQCLLCSQEPDAQFCSRIGAYCDLVADMDNCGIPRTTDCGTCTAPLTCQANHACGDGTTPTNDTCAQPEAIRLTGVGTLTATIHGDTTNATNGQVLSCNNGLSGNDVVYKLTVPPGPNMHAQVQVASSSVSNLVPNAALRSTCASSHDLACVHSTSATAPASLAVRNLVPGDYFLWVDGWAEHADGPFDMTVSLTPASSPPGNDACSSPEVLVFSGTTATATGDNASAMNDYTGTCGAMSGGDRVYSFDLINASTVTATVTRDASTPSLLPSVVIRSSNCASNAASDQLACGTDRNGVATAKISFLAPGTYYAIVDSLSDSFGTFTLQLDATAPLDGDTCANAIPVLIDPASGLASVNGDTTNANDDAVSSCLTSLAGADMVYQLTVPGTSPMRLDIELIPNSTSFVPALSVRTGCETTEVACGVAASSTPTTLTLPHVAPATYYLWIDGNGATAKGAFSINFRVSQPPPPPANDQCSQATEIPLVHGVGRASGTTASATDDSQGSCSTIAASHSGGDVAYYFTLNSTLNVAVSVLRAASTPRFQPAVYIRGDCADAATQHACGNASNGTVDTVAPTLTRGTYYVIVDGVAGTEGDFTIAVATYGSVTNERCSSAAPITFDSNGDYFAASSSASSYSDTGPSAGGLCPGAGSGPDLVYFVTLTSPTTLTIDVMPSSTAMVPVVYVRRGAGNCASTDAKDEVNCNDGVMAGWPAHLSLRNLTADTYYIWVDSISGPNTAGGPFVIQVHQTTPPPLQSNDTCSAPTELVPDVTGVATATGDLNASTGDIDGSCKAGSGADLVYSLTLTAPQAVALTVTPSSAELKPVLYVNSGCPGTTATERGCSSNATAGGATTLAFPVLGIGTYYVMVDSYAVNDTGPFTLTATLGTPPPPPPNDVCAGAIALSWNGASATVTDDTSLGTDDYASYCSTGLAPLTGPDLVYSFALSSAAQVTATVTRDPNNVLYAPAVSIRSSCASADELACARDSSGVSSLVVSLNPGAYYVFVDGVGSTSGGSAYGAFTLTLSKSAAVAADSCGNPGLLVIDPISGIGSVSGTLVDARDDSSGSCLTATGNDMLYAFTLTADKTVTVTLESLFGPTTLHPNVYMRGVCSNPNTELACAAQDTSTPATFTLNRLPAGTYYIWVDSSSPFTAGPFMLTVTTTPPAQPAPANDSCLAAAELVIDGANGGAAVVDDTSWAFSDYFGSCQSPSYLFSGPDMVYTFTLSQAATVYASVARHSSAPTTFYPALYLRTTCDDAMTEVACTTTTAAAAASITQRLQPGRYYLFVDGQKGSSGKFVLNVSATPSSTMSNDSCATAQALTFDSTGVAVAAGSTRGLANDSTGSCNTSSTAADAVYYFTLTDRRRVTVDLNPAATGVLPMVYVRTVCGTASTEMACSYAFAYGGAENSLGILTAGTYYVFVDEAYAMAEGPFVLAVRTEPPPRPPANDDCAGATTVVIDPGTGKGSVSGDTQLGTDGDVSFCSLGTAVLNGPDLVYTFTLNSAASLTAKVTRDAANTVYKPAVSIRSSCAPTDELVCARDASGVSTATATLSQGTYYVFVDGVGSLTPGSNYGAFTLELSTAAPIVGDSCGSEIPIAIDPTSGIGIATGDLTLATKSTDGSCLVNTGNDMVYKLTLPAEKTVQVALASAGGSLRPNVYLRSTCADPATEMACAQQANSTTPATFTINRVRAGTYYLWADDWGANNEGPFTLTVTTSTPIQAGPTNDSCAAPTVIALDPTNNSAHFTGDLAWALNDYAGGCGTASNALTAGDVVYELDLASAGWVYAMVGRDPWSNWYPALYMRTTCSAGAADTACAMTANGFAATLVQQLQAGTYYFFVDGQKGNGGPFDFDLVVRATNTVGANDTCAAAETLNLDANGLAAVAGTTVGATSNYAGSCNSGSSSSADLVYKLVLSGEKDVTVDVVPGSNNYPMVYLQTTCGDSTSEVACGSYYGNGPTRVYKRLPAGTYYIVVDAPWSSATGPFSLNVTAVTPVSPVNDTCAGAQVMSFGAYPQTQTLSGATLPAQDDYWGSCAPSNGPDLVYAIQVASPAQLTATVSPYASSAYKPVVYLRTVCATNTAAVELACGRTTTAGSAATITVPNLPTGTYYLIVDGSLTAATDAPGRFTLSVTLDNPVTAVPLNDSCATAQAITLGPAGTTTTLTNQTTVHAGDNAYGSCGTSSAAPDVVYSFTLTSAGKITAKVTPDSGSTYYPAVYLHASNCGGMGGVNSVACASSSSATPATLTQDGLHAGTYYLWVDSYSANAANYSGAFTLAVTLDAAGVTPPANDDCSGAIALAFGVPFTGDTTGAINDYDWGYSNRTGCQPPPNSTDGLGKEVVFSYTPTTSGAFKATFSTTWNSAMWVGEGGACGDGHTCVGGSDRGNPEFVVVNGVAGTTYWIYCEGSTATTVGTYTMTIAAP